MAIQETQRKIHFTPFTITKGRMTEEVTPSPTMSLTTKNGALRFNKSVISELGLNGKFIKLFFEPQRRIIGFQFRATVSHDGLASKQWKLVKQNKTSGAYTVTINKMLAQLNNPPKRKIYSNMPVKKYVEKDDMIGRGEVYYYVQLVDNPEELKKGIGNDTLENMSTA